ncbi:MAG: hypothetical protein HOP27_10870 [Anaerolineales bacterium]|nr:hypothetical protein [Anaerolineales bacterium]
MNLLDTQIISYSFKGAYEGQVMQQSISSVTAKEFLLVQGLERTKANYYIPMPKAVNHLSEGSSGFPKRDHPFPKGSTDQIILEFGNDYPAMIEFGNLAVSETINLKAKQVFTASIQFLEKEKRKIIMDRFGFLLNQNITCLPLNKNTVELGLNLFHEFLSRYNTKENFKNTVNDVFILATAINTASTLVTKDSLLNRFASEYCKASLKEVAGTLLIDFGKEKSIEIPKSRESKGYINKGWRVQVRNYQGAW